jgi:hypothetical protein
MATNRTGRHIGRYHLAPLAKTASVLFGLSAILYVAVTTAEHAPPISTAAAGFAPENRSAIPGPATDALDPRAPVGNSHTVSPPEAARGQSDGPRECRLDAGIDSGCTFN